MTTIPSSPERKELLAYLKNPKRSEPGTFRSLREYALRTEDQTIQCAAIQGLERLGGLQAVLTLSERLLDSWGLKALERAIRALGNLAGDGGALALTALLYQDARLIWEKIDALEKCATVLNYADVIDICRDYRLHRVHPWKLPAGLPDLLSKLSDSPFEEIRFGAILARGHRFPMGLGREDVPPNQATYQAAVRFTETRIPGLISLLAAYEITTS